jgi:hypothetical protein
LTVLHGLLLNAEYIIAPDMLKIQRSKLDKTRLRESCYFQSYKTLNFDFILCFDIHGLVELLKRKLN